MRLDNAKGVGIISSTKTHNSYMNKHNYVLFVSSGTQHAAVMAQEIAKRKKGGSPALKDVKFLSCTITPEPKSLDIKNLSATLTHFAKLDGDHTRHQLSIANEQLVKDALVIYAMDATALHHLHTQFPMLTKGKEHVSALTSAIPISADIVAANIRMNTLYGEVEKLIVNSMDNIAEHAEYFMLEQANA